MEHPAVVESSPVRVVPRLRWSEISPVLSPLAQLGLVLLLIRQYQIESQTFFQIAVVAVVGFAIHALLPLAYRLPFFVLLSFTGIGVAFGWRDGGWLVATGLLLIGICHLPVRLLARVAILALVGGTLALSRGGVLPALWSASVWPILASMFMFRLAVYLYALEHDRTPVDPYRSLAYFFMLPNVCFPLFPVVDYGTFTRTYYDRDAGQIYQQGVQWIVRGLIQLLLYRFVYQYLANDPAQIDGLGGVVQFALSTYLLYLRVSGQFHLIVGILLLFGFRLPETHRLYYLASSFTDFWRRINIYWKDFMMKLVYYPSFFRLRRWGDRTALVGATVIVFLATWILHSYQWFWLRGGFPVTAQDGLFWGILGAFVVFNALRELKRGRKRSLSKPAGWDWRLAIRTAAMFWGMTILWSLWSAESLEDWLALWPAAARVDGTGVALIVGVTAGFLLVGGRVWDAPTTRQEARGGFLREPAVVNAGVLVGLLLLSQPIVNRRLEPLPAVVTSLRANTLNTRDASLQHRGYYEQLDNGSRMSAELWGLREMEPPDWNGFAETEFARHRDDFLLLDIQPSATGTFKRQPLSTNQWGMRDREYELARVPGTTRTALLGPSLTMGSGVADDETFDTLLEERLNGGVIPAEQARHEILNFGAGGHSILQTLALFEDRVLDFRPDAVIVTIPRRWHIENLLLNHLLQVIDSETEIPYPEVRRIARQAGVDEAATRGIPVPSEGLRDLARQVGIPVRMPSAERRRRLAAYSDSLVDFAVGRIADRAREHGISPVMLALDEVSERAPENDAMVARLAREHDYVLLNLFDVYETHDLETLRVAAWDNHPNVQGTRLIADRLYRELRSHPDPRLRRLLDTPTDQTSNRSGHGP